MKGKRAKPVCGGCGKTVGNGRANAPSALIDGRPVLFHVPCWNKREKEQAMTADEEIRRRLCDEIKDKEKLGEALRDVTGFLRELHAGKSLADKGAIACGVRPVLEMVEKVLASVELDAPEPSERVTAILRAECAEGCGP